MTRLTLVRHGRAASSWNAGGDPGLDDHGRSQAEAMAEALAPSGPLPIVVSPLRRTLETAAALERRWQTTARVEPGVGEIPTPDDVPDRGAWLRAALAGTWHDLGAAYVGWRDGVVQTLAALPTDSIVVTHFVAINVAVGAATDDGRVVCFTPDNCSRTVLDFDGERISVIELGTQATTVVQ